MKKKALATIILVLLSVTLFWQSDDKLTPEEKVAAVLNDVIDKVEAKDLAGVMKNLSTEYKDEEGWTKNTIRGILFRQFRMKKNIGVTVGPMGVSIKENHAQVSFEALIMEKDSGLTLPSQIDAFHFEVNLKKNEDIWQIHSHSRIQAGKGDL